MITMKEVKNMNCRKIIESINSKIKSLDNDIEIIDEQIEELEKILKELNFSSTKSTSSIDRTIIIAACIFVDNNIALKELIKKIRESGIEYVSDTHTLNGILKYLYKKQQGKLDLGDITFSLVVSRNCEGINWEVIEEFAMFNIKSLRRALFLEFSIFHLKEEYELINNLTGKNSPYGILIENVNVSSNYKELHNDLLKLNADVDEKRKKYYNQKKILRKARINYESVINLLSKLHFLKYDVKEFNNILSMIKDEDIKKEYLLFINSVLEKKYDDLTQKLNQLNGNRSYSLKAIFKEYRIAISDEELEKIDFSHIKTNEEFKKLISLLIKIGITDISSIIFIVNNSSIDIVEKYSNDITSGVLDKTFIVNNIDLFSEENYLKYESNLSIIDSFGVNREKFINHNEVLFSNSSILYKNLSILENYDLIISFKNSDKYYFLLDDNLSTKINLFIDLGMIDELKNNIELLNYDRSLLNRLLAIDTLNGVPKDIDSIKKYLEMKNFFISDEKINQYFTNIYRQFIPDSILELLDNNVSDSDDESHANIKYFGNIPYSTLRYFKNKSVLENLDLKPEEIDFYSLIYGSNYSMSILIDLKNSLIDLDSSLINKSL